MPDLPSVADSPRPVILFGAFDRHNFGDLLLAHVAAELLRPRPVVFAGLAERDLTPFGGHRVRALAALAREWGERPADVVQVGGEVLTCPAYEAAVMLLRPAEARAAIARYDADPAARLAWAQGLLRIGRQVAYLAPREEFGNPRRFVCHAVGGVDLARLPEALRAEVHAGLRAADRVSVRDRFTLAHLLEAGIAAELTPDSAVLTAELFGGRVAKHAAAGEPAAVCRRFPQGYLAVQFSADFGDDATLRALAFQLDRLAAASGLGLCLFCAGTAPWHDDPEVYRRLLGFLATPAVWLFESPYLWDICALLARASGYCGSSLHGRIVAGAFGVAGLNLLRAEGKGVVGKATAHALTWDAEGAVGVAPADAFADALLHRLATDPAGRLGHARHLAGLARSAGEALRGCLA